MQLQNHSFYQPAWKLLILPTTEANEIEKVPFSNSTTVLMEVLTTHHNIREGKRMKSWFLSPQVSL